MSRKFSLYDWFLGYFLRTKKLRGPSVAEAFINSTKRFAFFFHQKSKDTTKIAL
jgi:hypothetical protein